MEEKGVDEDQADTVRYAATTYRHRPRWFKAQGYGYHTPTLSQVHQTCMDQAPIVIRGPEA